MKVLLIALFVLILTGCVRYTVIEPVAFDIPSKKKLDNQKFKELEVISEVPLKCKRYKGKKYCSTRNNLIQLQDVFEMEGIKLKQPDNYFENNVPVIFIENKNDDSTGVLSSIFFSLAYIGTLGILPVSTTKEIIVSYQDPINNIYIRKSGKIKIKQGWFIKPNKENISLNEQHTYGEKLIDTVQMYLIFELAKDVKGIIKK